MFRNMCCAMALAVATFPAHAQDAEVSKLRDEMRKLQQRVQQLEARPSGQSGFNPEISLILQGTAARSSRDPDTSQITGFAPSGGKVGPAR